MLDWVDSNMDKLDGRELYPLWIKDQVFVRKCSSAEERAMMVSGLSALLALRVCLVQFCFR